VCQRVVVCCSALQCVSVCFLRWFFGCVKRNWCVCQSVPLRVLQRVAACCSALLQSVAECCSVLQSVAECYSVF